MSTVESQGADYGVDDLAEHYKSITRWWSAVRHGLSGGDYAGYHVLVADDEMLVCELLARTVRSRLGCVVEVAHSGGEVLQRLEERNYEVLITDMVMPGLNGLHLVQRVRAAYPDIAVMVLTGFPDNFPFVEIIKAGANDFISKPHLPQELEAKLIRIFEERRLRDAQILAEAKYRSLFEYSMDPMALIDPRNNVLVETNRAFATLCGHATDMAGTALLALLPPADRERLSYGLSLCETAGQSAIGDLSLVNPDGRIVSIDASLSYIAVPGQRYVLLIAKDVTEKRELERTLADAAERDVVTGLSNKRRFRNRLEWAVERAAQDGTALILLFIDLDNFKNCNDTYGHQTGDDLLRQVGKIIKGSIRTQIDEGYRFGGDEFAVILIGANVVAATSVAERIRREFSAGNAYGTTMSIGISAYAPPLRAADFVQQADKALYAAKSKGKNVIVVG